jgi:RimJ/RimL family protein N-acetyltransferase
MNELFSQIIILENDFVRLRPIRENDFDEVRKIAFDPSIWTHFVYRVSDHESFNEYFTDMLQQHKAECRYTFIIEHIETLEILGITALGNYSAKDERIEIGWTWASPKHRGSQYSQTTVFILLNYLFDHMKLKRVEFKTDVLNKRARNRLKKIGCTEEGVLRSHTLMPGGRRRDTIFYSILDHEWPAIRSTIFIYCNNIKFIGKQ